MDLALFVGIMIEIAATAFILWLIPRKNWALFCETIDCFPENVRRRLAWRKRKILRAWNRLQTVCLQCHVAGGNQFRIKN